jgi:hypothetical protein
MKIIRARAKLVVVSTLLLFSMFACQFLPQTTPIALPTLTVTVEGNANSPVPTKNSTVCPPENTAFPNPDELENYLGWQYLQNPAAFDYPEEEFGTLLSIDKDYDYGISAYGLGDNSSMLVLEKFLCNDSTGLPAWEIIDAVRTRPLTQDELIYLGSNCIKNGEPTTAYQFVIVDQSNNGKVYSAWSIDQNKKITEASVDGLSCSFGG